MAVSKCCHYLKCINLAAKVCTSARLSSYCQPMRCMSTITKPGLDLTFEKYEGKEIALVRMTNDDNRLSPQVIDDFGTLLSEIESNKSCQILITTGQGKYFSNGLDKDHVASLDSEGLRKYLEHLSQLLLRLLVLPMVTVAAVNGHAFAGGAFLALSHDLRAMRSDRGWLSWNEIFVSIRFPTVLLQLVRQKIPPNHHSQAIVFGKRFTAPEALQAGIVDHITEEGRLLEDAKLLANQLFGPQGFNRDLLKTFKNDLYRPVLELFPQAKKSV
ncbi:enoyl-CoA delta isomerase 2, peroxisomal-like [Gigantopelta aegis]|uniref:enoyl-CoA delta isomerase 2, peroxisomal-like n=1 Tax=Gigantopelta aegis TaxID=1735272 RepID=UPI001B889054|nr:enoyl-CoA delta isomerase 2, peroxisomal-like [Gigantopelta aegis]